MFNEARETARQNRSGSVSIECQNEKTAMHESFK